MGPKKPDLFLCAVFTFSCLFLHQEDADVSAAWGKNEIFFVLYFLKVVQQIESLGTIFFVLTTNNAYMKEMHPTRQPLSLSNDC